MVGNDIVDLRVAKKESNWQRPRFLEKLFTLKEQQLIRDAQDSFIMVWRLWAMKEAAYKLYTQINPSRFYNPKGFECQIEGNSGTLKFQDFKCYVQTKLTSNYILSEARLNKSVMNSEVIVLNSKNLKTQSTFLKTKLLESISENYNISIFDLNFKKSEFGIPQVNFNSESLNISLTHHGNYGAFAI
jgi:phosphopantetheinyl transferase (holo-ACP synthase)